MKKRLIIEIEPNGNGEVTLNIENPDGLTKSQLVEVAELYLAALVKMGLVIGEDLV